MRKTLPLIINLLLFAFIFSPCFPLQAAETGNKFGLNIAYKSDQVQRYNVAQYLQQNGWVVMMPGAPDYSSQTADHVYNEIVGIYFSHLGGQVNYILRAHYPHSSNPDFSSHPTFPDQTDSAWAEKWADFWAGIVNRLPVPAGSDFYVIPWNEPNLQRECAGIGDAYNPDDCGCVDYVLEYITKLEAKINRGKVKLLSPAFAVSAPNFYRFVQCLGGADFLNRFDGIAMDYYDFQTECSGALCHSDPRLNPDKYAELLDQIGASGKKLFMVETGLVSPGACGPGVPDCPNFQQPEVTVMLCELYNRHKNDPNFVMFSPLTYNPERSEGDWFWQTSQTRNFYLERYSDCSLVEEGGKFIVRGRSPAYTTGTAEWTKEERETEYVKPPDTEPELKAFHSVGGEGEVLSETTMVRSQETLSNIAGSINYQELNFPDFSPISRIFSLALNALLPEKTAPSLNGQSKSKISTLVWSYTGEDLNQLGEGTGCEGASRHEQDLSGEMWGNSVLGAFALNGLFLPEGQLKDPEAYQSYNFELEEVDYNCFTGFGAGAKVGPADMPAPQPKRPAFNLSNLTISRVIERIEETIERIVTIFRVTKKVEVVHNANIPGGEIGAKSAAQLARAILPENRIRDFDPRDEAEALTSEPGLKLTVEVGGDSASIDKPVSYQSLARMRNYDCAAICSAYPQDRTEKGMEWVGAGKICPSCDSNDYQPQIPPKPRPADANEFCQWDGFGCHYYDPDYCEHHFPDQECDEVDLCEGGRCLETSLPPPGSFFCEEGSNCDISCLNQCHVEGFARNESGGFGPCYYQNPNVCVRNDGAGGCLGVCNWACCAYQ